MAHRNDLKGVPAPQVRHLMSKDFTMNLKSIALLATTLIAAGTVVAQDKPQKKLRRWLEKGQRLRQGVNPRNTAGSA